MLITSTLEGAVCKGKYWHFYPSGAEEKFKVAIVQFVDNAYLVTFESISSNAYYGYRYSSLSDLLSDLELEDRNCKYLEVFYG